METIQGKPTLRRTPLSQVRPSVTARLESLQASSSPQGSTRDGLMSLLHDLRALQITLAEKRCALADQLSDLLKQNRAFSKQVRELAGLEKSLDTRGSQLANRARKMAFRARLGKGMQQLKQLQGELAQVSTQMVGNRQSMSKIQSRLDNRFEIQAPIGGPVNGAGRTGRLRMANSALEIRVR